MTAFSVLTSIWSITSVCVTDALNRRHIPFVCHRMPFVWHKMISIIPYVGKNIPLIGIRAFQRGFSLTEIIITLMVLGILAGIAVPSIQSFVEANRLTAAANDLLADISTARTESMKRQGGAVGRVVICASTSGADCTTASTNWNSGWILFWDQDSSGTFSTASNDILIKRHEVLPSSVTAATIPAGILSLQFNQVGSLASAANTGIQFTNTKINKNRVVCLNPTGQVTVRATCP